MRVEFGLDMVMILIRNLVLDIGRAAAWAVRPRLAQNRASDLKHAWVPSP